jgi:hypothetical protein
MNKIKFFVSILLFKIKKSLIFQTHDITSQKIKR